MRDSGTCDLPSLTLGVGGQFIYKENSRSLAKFDTWIGIGCQSFTLASVANYDCNWGCVDAGLRFVSL